MGFMVGRNPVRRTLKYLNAGRLVFKENVKIFTINYNVFGNHHREAYQFVYWFVPQIQYKNPNVQVVAFRNMTPSPFMQVYFVDGTKMLIDVDSKPKEDVLEHLIKVVGKSEDTLALEAIQKEKKDNPANFGAHCERACICELIGQVPCTGVVPLPKFMRGKYKEEYAHEKSKKKVYLMQ